MYFTFTLLLVAACVMLVFGMALDSDGPEHQKFGLSRLSTDPLDSVCVSVETDYEYNHCLDALRTYLNATSPSQPSGQGVVSQTNKQGFFCGIFSTAAKRDVMRMLYDLKKAHWDATCGAPANTCLRQGCYGTSGLYLCNDNDHDISISCYLVALFLTDVGGCCTKDPLFSKGISGQEFSDEGWNVCIAYANCNHASDADRPAEFVRPYINGECEN